MSEENVNNAEEMEPVETSAEETSAEETFEAVDLLAETEAMYETPGFFTRIGKIFTGIGKPKNTREYKEARLEVQRLAAPLLAIVLPIILVVVLCVVTEITGKAKQKIDVEIARTENDDAALEEEQEQQDTEQQQVDTDVEITVDTPVESMSVVTPVESQTMSAAEQTLHQPDPNSVAAIRSPVTMKSVFGETRSAASRISALKRYGGDARTEEAVNRALRWLKQQQQSNGSWRGNTGADGMDVTGLVILTYLAHGEKTGGGEFGETVSRGLDNLIARARNNRLDPIGTHALAEAYGFLKNPNLKASATAAVKAMADDLCSHDWGPDSDNPKIVRPRLLRMAFQVMALRSARLSRIEPDNLSQAFAKLKEGFLLQGSKTEGGFSSDYYGPPRRNYRRTGIWHSMVGVVGLQYLGAGDLPIIEKTMRILDDDWEPPTLESIDSSCCPVRGNYWATMVFFNGGGKRWAAWNRKMIDVYFNGQTVQKGAYTDKRGIARDTGYWVSEDMHIGTQPTATTCWVAQQLMVYYRYLPTSAKQAWSKLPAVQEEKKEEKLDVDVEVDI